MQLHESEHATPPTLANVCVGSLSIPPCFIIPKAAKQAQAAPLLTLFSQ